MAVAVCGWDIGGAHLKAAYARDGKIVSVKQIACTLWLGEDHLERAFAEAGEAFLDAPIHAVTMTGELAENFASRAEGVNRIVAQCEKALRNDVRIYAAGEGLLPCGDAPRFWRKIASANWHATAALAARLAPEGFLADIGSTTTDIVPFSNGAVRAEGFTDAERLLLGELVYTGVVRTSAMTLASRVPFEGRWQPLMAENFSTAADIYRISGELDPQDDLYPASDGRGKSKAESFARLARMLGRDASDAADESWSHIADFMRERQLNMLDHALRQVLSLRKVSKGAPLIGAGAGHFLVRELARRHRRDYLDFGALISNDPDILRLTRLCAPAASVALLALR